MCLAGVKFSDRSPQLCLYGLTWWNNWHVSRGSANPSWGNGASASLEVLGPPTCMLRIWETTTKFCLVIKLDVRKIFTGSTRVSFSSFWRWVVLPQALKKMGNNIPYANKKWLACSDNKQFLIITKCTYMHVTMNRCGHLYTNIPYSKHCLHWIQISCHSQSQFHSHVSGPAYFSSIISALSTAST